MSTATETIEFNEFSISVGETIAKQIRAPIPTHTRTKLRTSLETSRSFKNAPSDNVLASPDDGIAELEPFRPNSPNTTPPTSLSKLRIALVILQPSLVNFFSSFTTGTVTVALPSIARDLAIQRSLYLWPSSVFSLTSGSLLLIAGSIADLIGPRNVELVGISLLGVFTLAGGFAQSGIQLVVFRALQGMATAMHLPASVSVIAAGVPDGRARNFGFSCLGLSQLIGFSVGLVTSGVLAERAGWRAAFFLSGGGLLVSAGTAFWIIPKVESKKDVSDDSIWQLLYKEVDWVGGVLASGGLALLAYVLAILSVDLSALKKAVPASLFAVSILLLVAFPFWMHRREKAGKPALVPNSLWKNLAFAITCIMIGLSYGVLTSMELFSSLFYQEIQKKSELTASLYLLPNLVVGGGLSLTLGLFVDRIPVRSLVCITSLLCALAPLFMAVVNPAWSYWYLEFWAQVFAPMSADVLFTVGLIIVSSNFPQKTQALAGAVFNTVTQFGQSFGVGLCQVVALGVIGPPPAVEAGAEAKHGGALGGADTDKALMGYRAAFWTMFTMMLLCGLAPIYGLRRAGKVGLKKEE